MLADVQSVSLKKYFFVLQGETFLLISAQFQSDLSSVSCVPVLSVNHHECEKIVFAGRLELGDNLQKTSLYKFKSFMSDSQGGRRDSSESHG